MPATPPKPRPRGLIAPLHIAKVSSKCQLLSTSSPRLAPLGGPPTCPPLALRPWPPQQSQHPPSPCALDQTPKSPKQPPSPCAPSPPQNTPSPFLSSETPKSPKQPPLPCALATLAPFPKCPSPQTPPLALRLARSPPRLAPLGSRSLQNAQVPTTPPPCTPSPLHPPARPPLLWALANT